MTAAEEVPGSDDGEAHGVLPTVSDPFRCPVDDAEDAVVGGDVKGVVGRVDAESVDVSERSFCRRLNTGRR
jgi:hypothetical protein